ncbi:hypothetical protein KXW08_007917, partial [Aspergillus fumigatus]
AMQIVRTKTRRRTAKSCGPGAATLASIPAGPCWQGNGDNKGRSPGRFLPLCFLLHRGLRAQSAPGFPCALTNEGATSKCHNPGKSVRGSASVRPRQIDARRDERRISRAEIPREAPKRTAVNFLLLIGNAAITVGSRCPHHTPENKGGRGPTSCLGNA